MVGNGIENFAAWLSGVIKPDYKFRHEFQQVGCFPDFVMQDMDIRRLNPLTNEIYISDHQVRHSLRPAKVAAGKALPMSEIQQLPDKLAHARWFFDSTKQNVMAVFALETDAIGKSVIVINFQKHKTLYNTVVTSGVIEERVLGMRNYRELKKAP
jgi:hypothetical protein